MIPRDYLPKSKEYKAYLAAHNVDQRGGVRKETSLACEEHLKDEHRNAQPPPSLNSRGADGGEGEHTERLRALWGNIRRQTDHSQNKEKGNIEEIN